VVVGGRTRAGRTPGYGVELIDLVVIPSFARQIKPVTDV